MMINKTVLCAVLVAAGLAFTAIANEFSRSGEDLQDKGNDGLYTMRGLTPEEEAHLVYMREEEKLARDVYITMYKIWKTAIFSNNVS